MESLKEHVVPIITALIGLAGLGFGIAGKLFWSLLKTIEIKISDLCKAVQATVINCEAQRAACRMELINKLASKEDVIEVKEELREWKDKRINLKEEIKDEFYTALDHHSHSEGGKVHRG